MNRVSMIKYSNLKNERERDEKERKAFNHLEFRRRADSLQNKLSPRLKLFPLGLDESSKGRSSKQLFGYLLGPCGADNMASENSVQSFYSSSHRKQIVRSQQSTTRASAVRFPRQEDLLLNETFYKDRGR